MKNRTIYLATAYVVVAFAVSVAVMCHSADIVVYPSPAGSSYYQIPATGVTNVYYEGADDGALRRGRAWPVPRFTIIGPEGTAATNQVRDNLTGLIWARDWNLVPTGTNLVAAYYYITNTMNQAAYGGATDWRLPNLHELESVACYQYENPCLCNTVGTGKWAEGDPFFGVQNAGYLTANTRVGSVSLVFGLSMSIGSTAQLPKTSANRFAAIRDIPY